MIMEISGALERQIHKQHLLGCKLALAFNIIGAIINYVLFKDEYFSYAISNLCAALIIGFTLLLDRRMTLSGVMLGLIPMLSSLTVLAYILNTLELELFQKAIYVNAFVYLSVGMIFLWNLRFGLGLGG